MIGISGIFNLNNIEHLNLKKSKITNFHNLKSKRIIKKNFLIEYIDNNFKEAFYKFNKNKYCIVIGEVYVKEVINNKISKSNYIYNLFKTKGISEVKKINGTFIYLIIEGSNLYLGKDKNCIIPCYYTLNNNNLIFSYDLTTILQSDNRNINLTHIFTPILCGGIHLDNSTFYNNYFKLESGSLIKIKNNNFSLSNEPHFSFIEEEDRGINYYIKNTKLNLENSIVNSSKKFSKIKLGLSGGLDSRIILAAINKLHLKLETFTYGTGQFVENNISSNLSEIMNIKHQYLNIKKNDYLKYADESLLNSSGILTTNMSPQINVFKNISEKNTSLVFGTFLDYLIGNSAYGEEIIKIQKISHLKNFYLKKYLFKFSKEKFSLLFNSRKLGVEIYDDIVEKVFRSIDSIEYDKISNLNNSFLFLNRGKRWHNQTLLPVLLNNNIILPSYDLKFLNFIKKIPSKYKKNDYLRIKVLTSYGKPYSDVILNKTMLPANLSAQKSFLFSRKQKELLKSLRNKWVSSKFNNKYSTSKYYDANFSEWISKFKNFNNFFKKRLFNDSPLKKILNYVHIKKLFKKQSIGKIDKFKFFIFISDYQQYLRKTKK